MHGYGSSPHHSPYSGGLGHFDDVVGMRGRQMVDPMAVGGMPMGGVPLHQQNGYHAPSKMRSHSPGGMGMRGPSPGRGMGGGMRMARPQIEEFILTDEAYKAPYSVCASKIPCPSIDD